MKLLTDYEGRVIRLTDERLEHILEHPEMKEMGHAIEETLANPGRVVQSISDPEARLYYRFYIETRVGDKYICIAVKMMQEDAFIITAYLTDTIKRGEVIWPKK